MHNSSFWQPIVIKLVSNKRTFEYVRNTTENSELNGVVSAEIHNIYGSFVMILGLIYQSIHQILFLAL